MPTLELQQELLDLTGKLIRIPSTHSRPEEILKCSDFIEEWLADNGISYRRQDKENVPTITVMSQANNVPVLLLCHFDVVEAKDQTLFEPFEREGRLYGRGAIDDKYAVALGLILFREHLQRLQRLGLSQQEMAFGLLLTGDEETGGLYGAKIVGQSLNPEFFIAIDGGNPKLIVTKEKGMLLLQLVAQGKAAHAARPWLGKNAFDLLIDDYHRLKQLFLKETPDHWHRTMVLSQCKVGGQSTNVVPDRAEATLDIRFTDQDDPEILLGRITDVVSSTIAVKAQGPVFTSGSSPYLDLLIQHSQGGVTGFEHGASDARHLSQRGIPGAVWGAEGEMSQHTDHEHIVIASFYRLYDCLDSYFTDLHQHRT